MLGNTFAEAMRDGATWVIKTTIAWWIEVPAIDLETAPVGVIRGYVQWLAVVVAVAGVMWQGILLALSRRPEPLFNVGRGLFYLALWSAIGVVGPAAALRAGDAFSTWVLDQAAGGRTANRLISLAGMQGIDSAGAVTVIGLLMILAGLVQAMLMLFREAAIVILAGVIVLAAAGTFTAATRPWLPRVLGWMLALITYKPAAALVYAAALALTGQGQDARTVVVGLTMMLLAIIALPVLMRFFTWTTGAATSGNGGGLAALAAGSAAAIHARAALEAAPRSGGAAQSQAAQLHSDLGSVGGSAGSAAAARGAATGAAAAGPVGAVVIAGTAAASGAASAARGTASSMTRDGRDDQR